jgi:hypothetical protein
MCHDNHKGWTHAFGEVVPIPALGHHAHEQAAIVHLQQTRSPTPFSSSPFTHAASRATVVQHAQGAEVRAQLQGMLHLRRVELDVVDDCLQLLLGELLSGQRPKPRPLQKEHNIRSSAVWQQHSALATSIGADIAGRMLPLQSM